MEIMRLIDNSALEQHRVRHFWHGSQLCLFTFCCKHLQSQWIFSHVYNSGEYGLEKVFPYPWHGWMTGKPQGVWDSYGLLNITLQYMEVWQNMRCTFERRTWERHGERPEPGKTVNWWPLLHGEEGSKDYQLRGVCVCVVEDGVTFWKWHIVSGYLWSCWFSHYESRFGSPDFGCKGLWVWPLALEASKGTRFKPFSPRHSENGAVCSLVNRGQSLCRHVDVIGAEVPLLRGLWSVAELQVGIRSRSWSVLWVRGLQSL